MWSRANASQVALAEAEQHFMAICDEDGEVDDDDVETAYAAMAHAAAEADETLNAIKEGVSNWSHVVTVVLR